MSRDPVKGLAPYRQNVDFVFIDRDGVINKKLAEGEYVTQPSEFRLLPGSADALALLNADGRKVIVVTNQRGIALGRLSIRGLDRVHEELARQLRAHSAHVDAIYYCPHTEADPGCDCRKPQCGLLERAFRDFPRARRDNSILIGDSLSDIQAGINFGLRTIFIDGDQRVRNGTKEAKDLADATATSLLKAVMTYVHPMRTSSARGASVTNKSGALR